nr:hypothetical protein [Tanacetum cinerariifolium]
MKNHGEMQTQRVNKFYAWLKRCFDNFHELEYDLLIKLEVYWWKVNDDECSSLANWRNLTSKMHENDLEVEEILKSDPYLDICKMISLTKNDKGKTIKEKPKPQRNNNDNMGSLENYLVQKDPPYFVNEEEEKSKERNCMLLGIPYVKPPTYKIERFKVVKYSFGPLEEYVAINELEHDIWVRKEENVSNGYQDIFYKKDDECSVYKAYPLNGYDYMSMECNEDDVPHVLVVADDSVNRKLVEMLLKICSCRVTTTENGMAALEYLGLKDTHQQNGFNGRGSKESSFFKEVPVVMMSSKNIPTRINECLEKGAQAFMLKLLKLADVTKLKQQLTKCKKLDLA